ncbi:hypothetical protein Lsed01_00872 [Demequina sediminis]|uniref:EAL domain-containing protein n=1 Tax=Demequina sediminis TaxID=1930058 RepID=A0ABP9WI41_9MICO|nr:GGDEF-domain containing protein [Demequina sediminis]
MGLSSPTGEGGARSRLFAPPSLLAAYVAVVSLLGFAGIGFVIVASPWRETLDALAILPVIFLAVAAITGEVKPIRLIGGDGDGRTLSTSAPFILALLPFASVGIAVLVQATASLIDDALHRRELRKSLFNTAQYALSVLAAGVVFSWLAGVPFFRGPMSMEPEHLGPLLAAGAAMILVNWLLVAVAISLSVAQPLWRVLRADARDVFVTNVVLLSIGGVAAEIAADGVGALTMLVAPVIAAHLFAAAAARHAHAAAHDSLTGLRNRGQLYDELARTLSAAHSSRAAGPGLVLFDLDHFKDFNDTLGHPVGDEILRQVADRLSGAAPDDASVHRLGGDEFAVVIRDPSQDVREAAQALLAALDTPVRIGNLELLVRASAGVAIAPDHGADGETLMKNADIALYHAKLERDRISTYAPEFDINTVERLRLLADLRTALDSDQLHVVYQPQVDLHDLHTVGVEALVRWEHPERGLVPPDEFIPLAENSGLIFPLTALVLDTALEELARWRAAGDEIRLAVNLSARHLSDSALPSQVAAALARHDVPSSALVLEVTETGILSDPARADLVIREVRELGVEIAIDDYGTGNASLSYLKRLEIDELKVDRSFVSSIGDDRHDLIIVRSTVALALALGLRVVAEGIEDDATVETLRGLGRVIGQGYHLGRPGAPEEISARLARERTAETTPTPTPTTRST